jgi:iron complex outermembrane receptor protein
MRSESLQEVPVAIKAFNRRTIEEAGITSMRDYVELTPNVYLQETQNTGFAFVNIRGLATQRNTDQAVAVSVDGVLLTNSLGFSQELYDIEQIEVLKGPQGALYGRNSAGGAINITTRQPTNEPESMIRVGAGNGDSYKVQGMYSGPISDDKLLFRVAASYQDSDGTRDNITTGIAADPYKEASFRGKLLWMPSEKVTGDIRFSYSDSQAGSTQFISNAPVAVDLPGFVTGALGTGPYPPNGSTTMLPRAVAAGVGAIVGDPNNTSVQIWGNQPGEDNRESWSLSAKFDFDVGNGTLTSITSFDDIEHLTEGEQLFYFPLVIAGGLNAINAQNRFGDAWSQEIRFTSDDDQRLRWIAGAYAAQTNIDVYFAIMDDLGMGINSFLRDPNPRSDPISPTKLFAAQFAGASGGIPAPITNPTEALAALGDTNENFAYAAFAQVNYDISDSLELSLALRYDKDEREQTTDMDQQFLPQYIDPVSGELSGPIDGELRKREFDSLQPKVSLRWQPSDTLMVYGSYSEGFRSGGFNPSGTAQAIEVMAVAGVVGLPSGVQDSFDKEESKSFELGFKSTLADGNLILNAAAFTTQLDNTFTFFFVGTNAAQTIRNIADSDITGLEIDAVWQVSDNFSADISYGLINSEIKSSSFPGVGGVNLVGNDLNLNPEDSFNLGLTYRTPTTNNLGGYVRLDYNRIGELFFAPENWAPRDVVNLVNLRAGIAGVNNGWEVTGWVKNALDENYFNELFNTFGIGYYARERRFGVDVTFRF